MRLLILSAALVAAFLLCLMHLVPAVADPICRGGVCFDPWVPAPIPTRVPAPIPTPVPVPPPSGTTVQACQSSPYWSGCPSAPPSGPVVTTCYGGIVAGYPASQDEVAAACRVFQHYAWSGYAAQVAAATIVIATVGMPVYFPYSCGETWGNGYRVAVVRLHGPDLASGGDCSHYVPGYIMAHELAHVADSWTPNPVSPSGYGASWHAGCPVYVRPSSPASLSWYCDLTSEAWADGVAYAVGW